MSQAPSDLAVAFRSFGRRLGEALAATKDDPAKAEAAQPLVRRLVETVASAAGEMGVPATDDVAATGAVVAGAINAIPADAWDATQLDHLRALALDAGHILRDLEAVVEKA